MSWCTERLKSSLDSIKKERDSMLLNLDTLIAEQQNMYNHIEKLDSSRLTEHSHEIMDVHMIHSELMQKIFEFHMNLQSYTNSPINKRFQKLAKDLNVTEANEVVVKEPEPVVQQKEDKIKEQQPDLSKEIHNTPFKPSVKCYSNSKDYREKTFAPVYQAPQSRPVKHIPPRFQNKQQPVFNNRPEQRKSPEMRPLFKPKYIINEKPLPVCCPKLEANVDVAFDSKVQLDNEFKRNYEEKVASFDTKKATNVNPEALDDGFEVNDEEKVTKIDTKKATSANLETPVKISGENRYSVNQVLDPSKLQSRRERYLEKLPKSKLPDLRFCVNPVASAAASESSTTDFFSMGEGGDSNTDFADCENTFYIEDAPIPKKGDSCTVTYVRSPDDFYIVPKEESKTDEIYAMVSKYVAECKNRFASKEEAKRKVNRYGIGYSKEWDDWYRCEVKSWYPSNCADKDLVEIQFIDYGDAILVPYKYLLKMPDQLHNFHRQSIRCNLELLHPPNGESEWPSKSVNAMKHFCLMESGCSYDFYIEYINVSPIGKLSIELVRRGDEHLNLTLGDLLINCGAAKQIVPLDTDGSCRSTSTSLPDSDYSASRRLMAAQIRNSQGDGRLNENANVGEVIDAFCNDLPPIQHETLGQAIEGYDCKDDVRICRFTKNGSCFKGTNCTLEHTQMRPDRMTTDIVIVPQVAPQTFRPQIGQLLDCMVTSYISPTQFYCQIKQANDGVRFKDLLKSMNIPRADATYEKFRLNPAIGELVIAKLLRKWYRARVLDVHWHEEFSKVRCRVIYVDLGETAELALDDVRKIREPFLNEPCFAYVFDISNVKRKANADLESFTTFFSENYFNRQVQAKVTYVGCNVFGATFTYGLERDVGLEIANGGFAELCDTNDYVDSKSLLLVD